MKALILYGSRYGTTRRYAKELSRRTGILSYSYEEAAGKDCDTLIYLGGLYAGSVLGLTKALRRLPENQERALYIVTVGQADPKNPVNVERIREGVKRQIPAELFEKAVFFHLRGAMDYQRLSLLHRVMMWGLCRHLKKLPPEKRTEEDMGVIDAYGKQVDFVDFGSLQPVIDRILQEKPRH